MSGYGRGTGGAVTQFSDSLHGPAGSLDPAKWAQGIIGITPLVTPTGWAQILQTGALAACNFQGTANPNTQLFNYATPIVIPGVSGKTQFSQVRFLGATGVANNRWGPVVAFRPSANPIAYWFRYINATPLLLDMVREAPNASTAPGTSLVETTLVTNINGSVVNANDVLRISVDFTVPSAPVVTCSINGVIKAQFTDNIVPLVGGQPGILATMHDAGYMFDNYSCGLGI